jgi:hypothetical protein
MELSEAFAIVRTFRPELTLQPDHICPDEQQHRMNVCRWPPHAVYTEFDAKHSDTPESLYQRLKAGSALKPSGISEN